MSGYINPKDNRYFGIINKQIDESPLKNKMWDKFLNVYEAEVSAEKIDSELFELYVNGSPGSEDNMAIIETLMEKKPAAEWIKAAFDITAMAENSTIILKDLMKLFNLQEDLYNQIEKKMKSELYYKTQADTYRKKEEELKKENLLLRNQMKELEDENQESFNAIPSSEEVFAISDHFADLKSSIEDSVNKVSRQIIENIIAHSEKISSMVAVCDNTTKEYYQKIGTQFCAVENNILNAVNEIQKMGNDNLLLLDMDEFDKPEYAVEEESIRDERNISFCKVNLCSKVTESSKKDTSEEKKAGMFQFFKFRVASEKKKREMLLNALLKKQYPMEQIETVRKIMKERKIDLNYVYEVINKEDTTFDDLKRILIFTAVDDTKQGDETV